jgi:hypothetical protein
MPAAPAIYGIEFNMATAPDLAIEFNRGGWTMAVQGKEFTGDGRRFYRRERTERREIKIE